MASVGPFSVLDVVQTLVHLWFVSDSPPLNPRDQTLILQPDPQRQSFGFYCQSLVLHLFSASDDNSTVCAHPHFRHVL